MLDSLGIQIIYFGCGLCLLQALERVLESGKPASPQVLFYLFNATLIFGTAQIARGTELVHPLSLFLFFSSLLIIGPLNLFYYHSLLYPARPMPYRVWLHIIPFLACLATEIAFQAQPEPFKRDIHAFIFAGSLHPARLAFLFVFSTHPLLYMLYVIKVFQIDLGFRRTRREFRFIGLIAMLVLVVIAMFLASFIADVPGLFLGGSVVNVFIHICLFLGMRMYPQFFAALKSEIRKKRYEKTMLRGIDTDAVRERLTELMTDERVYRDGEMTLAGLARRLSLTPHQLSEFLNEQMGEGFRDYVSRHRIEEARRILRETPRANIMAVCFRVGFNSKSSFNTAFRKFTGLTPSEYKNRGHDRPGPAA